MSTKRYDSIDVMRTIAIIWMVPCHFLLFLAPYEEPYTALYVLGNEILGGFSAPLFLLLVGISQAVSLSRKPPSEKLLDATGARMLKRGAFVFAVGQLFQLPIEGPPYEWDVLPFIGASLITLCFIRNFSNRRLLAIVIGVFLISPLLRGAVGYLDYWEPALSPSDFSEGFPALWMDPLTEYRFGNVATIGRVVTGFLVTGYFPFFPWILFPVLGLILGRVYFTEKVDGSALLKLCLGGTALVAAGISIGMAAVYYGSANIESGFFTAIIYYPPVPLFLTATIGVCLITTGLCRWIYDRFERKSVHLNYSRLVSRYSLSIYMLHYMIAYWPPRLTGLVTGEGYEYLGHSFNVPVAWGLAIVVMVLFHPLCMAWDRIGGRGSMEWLMTQFVPRARS